MLQITRDSTAERRDRTDERRDHTAYNNRALILEQEDRKAEGKTTMRLKTMLANEREERQVGVVRLEEKVEQQGTGMAMLELSIQQCEAELAKAKAQQRVDMQTISEVHTTTMTDFDSFYSPVHTEFGPMTTVARKCSSTS